MLRFDLSSSFPEELYGDFEDLETGKVHKGEAEEQDQPEVSAT